MFVVNFQVITEDLEKRVEESKKEYDNAKEQAKKAIAQSVVQTEVITFNPSNETTVVIPGNISSTTLNKYAFSSEFYTHTFIYYVNYIKFIL